MALKDREEVIASLLEVTKNGATKAKMRSTLSVAPTQLRKILAELMDKGFLHFVEAQQLYNTTHKGYLFLNTLTQK
jgi:predicted transcriptional regulator